MLFALKQNYIYKIFAVVLVIKFNVYKKIDCENQPASDNKKASLKYRKFAKLFVLYGVVVMTNFIILLKVSRSLLENCLIYQKVTEVENDHLFHLKVKQIEKEKEYEKNHC